MDSYTDDFTNVLNQNINDDQLPGSDDDGNGNGSGEDNREKNDQNDDPNQTASSKVEPKKRAIRNPRIRLTVNSLKGQRGLHTIEKYFDNIKYHGKGHEKQDLDEILRRMQHWAHRMCPNYKFDDVILNIERLSKKKPVQFHMNHYRLNLLDADKIQEQQHDNEINDNIETLNVIEEEPFDEFDALLSQQIAISKLVPPETSINSSSSMRRSPIPQYNNRPTSTGLFNDSNSMDFLPSTPPPPPPVECQITTKLNAAQMAQIAENRRLAQEKLKAKKESLNNNLL